MDKLHRPTRADIDDVWFLRACRDAGTVPVDYFASTGIPPKLTEAKVLQLVKQRYMDYGVSVRTAWVEPAGKELLKEAGV